MISLALALALSAQAPEAAAAPEPPPAAEDRIPTGAPTEDYPFVAWCYGALRGYLEMHDEMMPEVKRIEGQFRRPGSSLADDLKVYADMRRAGQEKLKVYQAALTAAEKASVRPINAEGAQAVRQGRQTWNAGPEVTTARRAQEWMSWALPARCDTVAARLETQAKLAGAALKANAEAEPVEKPTAEPSPEPPPPGQTAAPEGAPSEDTPAATAPPSTD